MAKGLDSGQPQGHFPSTLWSQIFQAKAGNEPDRREALDNLFEAYWRPIYAVIRFGWNRKHEEAKDLTQSFIVDLIEREFWKEIDPSLGRFRAFLKAALRNYMLNDVQASARIKRGGDKIRVSLDQMEEYAKPIYAGSSPDDILDQEWIETLLTQALEKLKKKFPPEEGNKHYDVLRLYYLEPAGEGKPTYSALAQQLGITETAVRYHLSEARSQLRTLVVETVREYCGNNDELEEETKFILGSV